MRPSAFETTPRRRRCRPARAGPATAPAMTSSQSAASANSLSRWRCTSSGSSTSPPHASTYASRYACQLPGPVGVDVERRWRRSRRPGSARRAGGRPRPSRRPRANAATMRADSGSRNTPPASRRTARRVACTTVVSTGRRAAARPAGRRDRAPGCARCAGPHGGAGPTPSGACTRRRPGGRGPTRPPCSHAWAAAAEAEHASNHATGSTRRWRVVETEVLGREPQTRRAPRASGVRPAPRAGSTMVHEISESWLHERRLRLSEPIANHSSSTMHTLEWT